MAGLKFDGGFLRLRLEFGGGFRSQQSSFCGPRWLRFERNGGWLGFVFLIRFGGGWFAPMGLCG